MVDFLSPAWIDALHDAASSSTSLRAAATDLDLSVEQTVVGGGVEHGPDGAVRYHLILRHGSVAVRPGALPTATVRFEQDIETAAAIASGRGSAQRAFMTGRLRVGGDLRVLLEHGDLLAQLDDAFAEVRAKTTFPAPGPD